MWIQLFILAKGNSPDFGWELLCLNAHVLTVKWLFQFTHLCLTFQPPHFFFFYQEDWCCYFENHLGMNLEDSPLGRHRTPCVNQCRWLSVTDGQ